MRRLAVPVLAFALTVLGAVSPAAAAVIQNLGDFEGGTLGAWQQAQWTLDGDCGWAASSNPDEGWLSGYAGYAPSGGYQAVADHALYYSTAVLYRDFTVPMNADSLKLRLWYRSSVPGFVADMPTLEPGGQGQGMRIDVMSPAQPVLGMAGIVATPFATSYPGNAADWLDPVTVRMSVVSLRGQSVRLRIAAMANTGQMVVGVDDVRLEGAQYLEVATSLPSLRDGAAEWGDYDGDGDLDLAIMGNDGATRVSSLWRNDAGTLVKLLDLPIAMDAGDLEWLDLDRDGDLDLVATGAAATGNGRAMLAGTNLGSGAFSWTSLPNGWAHTNLALADMDGDGDADLAGAYSFLPPVLRNDGTGTPAGVSTSSIVPLDSSFVYWERHELPNLYAFGWKPGAGASPTFAVYSQDGTGSSFTGSDLGAFYAAGVYEIADADGDGLEEAFLSGRVQTAPNTGMLDQRVERENSGNPVFPDDIPALYAPFAKWMDDDADGDMDLLVGGLRETGRYTQLHHWAAGALSASGDAFPQLDRAACAWGDYDGDGDPDLLLLGESASGPITRFYLNTLATPNLPAAAPAMAAATFSLGQLTLNCLAASDDHTPSAGLTYDFRAGASPGGADLVSTDANLLTGRRRTAHEGNAANRRSYPLRWTGAVAAARGPIYCAAQAVDGARLGGAWSPEAVVHLGGRILSVTDVAGDQGGAVRVRLCAGLFDTALPCPAPVTSYTLWQRVDTAAQQASVARAAAAAGASAPAEGGDLPALAIVTLAGRTFVAAATAAATGFPEGTWEAVGTVPAMQQPEYLARIGTVADSGATGTNWSVYCVSSHTAGATTWWVSPADSGKSVDNIAPGVPQGLTAQYHTGGGNTLAWQPSADGDFQYFRVYRGDSPDFAIGAGALAANVAGTQWSDPANDAPGVWYRVTAVDHNGNESAAASPGQVTDVETGPGPAFALAAPSPSPFSGSTRIAFTLPRASHVALEVYDAGGRRLRTLANGPMAAGAHELAWDGSGEGGARAVAGIVFVRLRADGREAVRRVVALGGAR